MLMGLNLLCFIAHTFWYFVSKPRSFIFQKQSFCLSYISMVKFDISHRFDLLWCTFIHSKKNLRIFLICCIELDCRMHTNCHLDLPLPKNEWMLHFQSMRSQWILPVSHKNIIQERFLFPDNQLINLPLRRQNEKKLD